MMTSAITLSVSIARVRLMKTLLPRKSDTHSQPQELRHLFVAELILSGELDEMTKELCGVWLHSALKESQLQMQFRRKATFLIAMELSRRNWPIG